LGFGARRIIRLDQRIEQGPQLVGIGFALHRVRTIANRRRSDDVGRLFRDNLRRCRGSPLNCQRGKLVRLGQLGRFGEQRLERLQIDNR
jgi:hypothetical protein